MGRKKNIKSPEQLWQYFEEYKKDTKANPKKENFFSAKLGRQVSVDREVPLTWVGFSAWLNRNGYISDLGDYRKNKGGRYEEYAPTIKIIDNEIYEDKFGGAAAGVYSPSFIGKDIGLVEKRSDEVDLKGSVSISDWLKRKQ